MSIQETDAENEFLQPSACQLLNSVTVSLFFHAGAIVVPYQGSHIRSEFTYPAKDRFLKMRLVLRAVKPRDKTKGKSNLTSAVIELLF